MKSIYDNYIKISCDKKLSDNVFKVRITLSAIAILSCLTIMLSTAFALFNTELTQNITMRAAVWEVDIEEVNLGEEVGSVYKCPQTDEEMHKFVLSRCGTATEGYCIISIKGPAEKAGKTEEYCTVSFTDKITINIQAVEGCEIKFIPMWGKPGNYEFTETYGNGDTIISSFAQQTKETSTKDSGADDSSTSAENDSSQSDNSDDSLISEKLSNEVEDSSSEEETSSSENIELGSLSESTSAPAQSMDDSSSSSLDSSSLIDDSASSIGLESESSSSFEDGESSSESSATALDDGSNDE